MEAAKTKEQFRGKYARENRVSMLLHEHLSSVYSLIAFTSYKHSSCIRRHHFRIVRILCGQACKICIDTFQYTLAKPHLNKIDQGLTMVRISFERTEETLFRLINNSELPTHETNLRQYGRRLNAAVKQ